jgi:hypothetical protein
MTKLPARPPVVPSATEPGTAEVHVDIGPAGLAVAAVGLPPMVAGVALLALVVGGVAVIFVSPSLRGD